MNVIAYILSNLNLLFPWIFPAPDPYGYWDITGCLLANPICPNTHVTYYLYTTKHPEPRLLDPNFPDYINRSLFMMDAPIKLVLHGFTTNHEICPNKLIAPAYLSTGNYNVIAAEYHDLVRFPCYLQAIDNMPVIANCSAHFVETILVKKLGFSLKNITIIGHSLGAQCAGLMGQKMTIGNISRLIGLEPAAPGYWDTTTHAKSRLDPSDADHVMVVHTDSGELGKLDPCGHVDFYPNGGDNQPSCRGIDFICEHGMAITFFAESIQTSVGFWGYRCPTLADVTANPENCDNNFTALMGDNIDPSTRGIFRVDTSCSPPFAIGKKRNKCTQFFI